MGAGASSSTKAQGKSNSMRLVLYSEHAAELPQFEEALQGVSAYTVGVRYKFSDQRTGAVAASELLALLRGLVKKHTGGKGFTSVALIQHGPNRPPEALKAGEECRWELTANLVLTDPAQLLKEDDPVRRVMVALGSATVPGGRVDLLSCALLKTWACPEHKWPQLMPFVPIETETSCHFTASEHLLDAEAWASEDDWAMESDAAVDIKASYFLPPEDAAPLGLLRVSAMHKKYNLGEVLGRGQFAVVRHATLRTPAASYAKSARSVQDAGALTAALPAGVAIKVIDKAKCEASMDEIALEVQIMAMVQHEHILRLYESFGSPKRLYMVLELATGGELFDRIVARGSYSEADAASVMRQLCDALAHMHTLGVVHSDLKPSNLILASPDEDAPLKVCDFGLASVVLGASTHAANSLVGTPDYMAPEILSEAQEEHRPPVDMWATGAILYVMLVGRPPFGDISDLSSLIDNIVGGRFDRCEGGDWQPISASAKDLVLKLLERHPSKRLMAGEVLRHPWLHFASSVESGGSLAGSAMRLKQYNARRRLQKAAKSALAASRMQRKAAAALQLQRGKSVDAEGRRSRVKAA